MTRTIGDLRAMLEQQSGGAPSAADRIGAVERKIRVRRRRRLAAGAASGAVVLVVTGLVVMLPHTQAGTPGHGTPAAAPGSSRPGSSRPAASESGSVQAKTAAPPPLVYQGMKRILSQRFTVTGELMTMQFTPTGPDTAYVIQCDPGYEVIQQTDGAGGYGSFGDCSSTDDTGRTTLFGPGTGRLQQDRSHLLEVVVLPEGTVKENSIEYMNDGVKSSADSATASTSLEKYLATHPTGRSPWSVAVYSGVCDGDC